MPEYSDSELHFTATTYKYRLVKCRHNIIASILSQGALCIIMYANTEKHFARMLASDNLLPQDHEMKFSAIFEISLIRFRLTTLRLRLMCKAQFTSQCEILVVGPAGFH